MKKTLLFTIAIVALGFTKVHAQKIGFRAAFNSNKIAEAHTREIISTTIEYFEDSERKGGFHFGPVVEFEFGKVLALETGLLVTRKGSQKLQGLIPFGTDTTRINLTYLEIPINLKCKIELSDFVGVYVSTGPYLAYGVGGGLYDRVGNHHSKKAIKWGKADGIDMFNIGDHAIPIDLINAKPEEQFNPFDYGFNFGGGVILGNAVQVGINYGHGLGNLLNVPATLDKKKNYIKHRVFSIGATYFFSLK